MRHIAGGVEMKQNRWVTRAKRWCLAAPGWTLVIGGGFFTAAFAGTFEDMRPAAILPPHIWVAIALVVAWAAWESRRKAVVVPGARGRMHPVLRAAIIAAGVFLFLFSIAEDFIFALHSVSFAWHGAFPVAIAALLPESSAAGAPHSSPFCSSSRATPRCSFFYAMRSKNRGVTSACSFSRL
jgi:hypothetical protein